MVTGPLYERTVVEWTSNDGNRNKKDDNGILEDVPIHCIKFT